jgi:hypothetical protein
LKSRATSALPASARAMLQSFEPPSTGIVAPVIERAPSDDG